MTRSRRRPAALVAALALAAAVLSAPSAAAPAPESAGTPADQNSPLQVLPAPPSALAGMLGHPGQTLRHGSAADAGLLPGPIGGISKDVEAGMVPQGTGHHPLFPGAVSLQAHDGVIVHESAHGYSDLYSDDKPTLLPPRQRVRTQTNTIYDLASLSKLFTTIVAMQLVDQGRLDLDAPVVRYLPAFAANGKGAVTIRQLLTHTSGFAPDPSPPLWQLPADQRENAILTSPLENPPGSTYLYSDLNMMSMQLVEQVITGRRLDALVYAGITDPLHLISTMYNPPASLLPRIAAEEYQHVPDRGLVHGVVHDENAWALDGVAGHAGVFSDADDLAVLAQTLLNGGVYRGTRILSKASVKALFTNLNQAFPGDNHGIGFELYQHWYMGALATPYTAGHTGFTGTDIVLDPTTDSFSILLTNAVHPSRAWGSTNPVRRAVADDLARAMPVHADQGATSWYSGMVDASTETLEVPATGGTSLDFAVWFDTEPDADLLTLTQSSDGGTTWTPLPFALRDGSVLRGTGGTLSGYGRHQWWPAVATPAPGTTLLRWTYTTDQLYHGRGVYLDGIRVSAGDKTVFDTRRPDDAARVRTVGFAPSRT